MFKKVIFPFLAVLLSVHPSQAGLGTDSGSKKNNVQVNVENFAKWFSAAIYEFPKNGNNLNRQTSTASRGSGAYKTYNEYDKASESPWVKREMMDKIALMSKELAKTAGTMFAPESAEKLRVLSKNMSNSKDPDFQAIGKDLSAQADAIASGDTAKADSVAEKLATMPRPYVKPGYKPSGSESAMAKAFNVVVGGIISNLTGVIGGAVLGGLLKSLGFDSGSLEGVGVAAGRNIGKGDNDKAGAAAIYGAGKEANKGINTIDTKERESVNSNTSGGAPSSR